MRCTSGWRTTSWASKKVNATPGTARSTSTTWPGLDRRCIRDQPHDAVRLQRLDRAGDRQIRLAGARRTYAEGQVAAADVRQIVALVGAARPDPAARHVHAMLPRVRIERQRA